MRVIRGLAALLALTVVLVAVPVFLVIFVGNPLPSDLDWSRLVGGLTRPDDGSILVGLVTIVAWIAWAVFAVSVIVEIVAVLSRQRVRIRLPGLVAPQRLASGLVLAVVAMVVVTPQLSDASPVRSTPVADHVKDASRSAVGPAIALAPMVDRVTSDDVERASSAIPPTAGTRYTVERGDDLWSLAERFYGEGREWRRIAAANPELLTGGPDRLTPGWRLVIPDAEQPPALRSVVVERGDTLSAIADRLWSDADRWPQLYEANRFQLDDPDELPVGLALVLPGTSAAKAKAPMTAQPDTAQTSRAEPRAETDRSESGDPGSTAREPDALPRPQDHGSAAEPQTPPGPVTPAPSVPSASGRSGRHREQVSARHGAAGRPARRRTGRGGRSPGGGGGLWNRPPSARTAADPAGGATNPAAVACRPAGRGAPRPSAAADGLAHPRPGDQGDRRALPPHRGTVAARAHGERAR